MRGIAVLVGCLLSGPATPTDGVVQETKRFDGTWRMVSENVEGQATPKDELQPDLEIVTKGDYALIRRSGKEPHATMRVDPAARPRTFDVVYLEDIAPGTRGRWSLGIYEWVNEDTFRLCRAITSPGSRPTEFKTEKGSGRGIVVWERVRK